VLRRHLANRWKEFGIAINIKIAEAKSNEIERELQLRSELKEVVKKEIDMRWAEKIQTWEETTQTAAAPMEGIITHDNPMLPIETNLENKHLETHGRLEESRQAPNLDSQNTPPIGPNIWREKIGRKRQRSKSKNSLGKNRSKTAPELQRLEAEILQLKEKIKSKEKATRKETNSTNTHLNELGWTQVNRKKPSNKNPLSLKIKGKYKLILGHRMMGQE
jgi:gas vesicle protein